MKGFIKNNLKVLVVVIISGIVFTGIGVYAASQYLASDISFTPSDVNFKKENGEPIDNVEDAINELYNKKSSINSPNNIVTDGLVFGFDSRINYSLNSNNVIFKNNMAYFNGKDSYVIYPNYQNDYITYEVYFNAEDISKTPLKIISSTENGGCDIAIRNGKVSFYVNVNNVYYNLVSDVNIVLNKDYHIVGTYDGNVINLYINGILEKYDEISGKIGHAVDNTITVIGAEPAGDHIANNSYNFSGYIKSARVYNRALSAEEVQNNYNYEKRS